MSHFVTHLPTNLFRRNDIRISEPTEVARNDGQVDWTATGNLSNRLRFATACERKQDTKATAITERSEELRREDVREIATSSSIFHRLPDLYTFYILHEYTNINCSRPACQC
jgi:predicted component of type VI protein secretion system